MLESAGLLTSWQVAQSEELLRNCDSIIRCLAFWVAIGMSKGPRRRGVSFVKPAGGEGSGSVASSGSTTYIPFP